MLRLAFSEFRFRQRRALQTRVFILDRGKRNEVFTYFLWFDFDFKSTPEFVGFLTIGVFQEIYF